MRLHRADIEAIAVEVVRLLSGDEVPTKSRSHSRGVSPATRLLELVKTDPAAAKAECQRLSRQRGTL
jgi:hypothetical protein